jgi:TFIIF-interacting CTD phosphatase-like protein
VVSAVSKPSNRPLLILDLDETLIRGATQALDRAPDMMLAHYFVYFRPHVRDFLEQGSENFTLALWSSATIAYIAPIARALWKGLLIHCLYGIEAIVLFATIFIRTRSITSKICAKSKRKAVALIKY